MKPVFEKHLKRQGEMWYGWFSWTDGKIYVRQVRDGWIVKDIFNFGDRLPGSTPIDTVYLFLSGRDGAFDLWHLPFFFEKYG